MLDRKCKKKFKILSKENVGDRKCKTVKTKNYGKLYQP